MLIQALCEYADKQLESNVPEGWQEQPIDFRIELKPDGTVADIVDVRKEKVEVDKKGKEKRKFVSMNITVPVRVQTKAIRSYLLDHRSLYIWGLNYDNHCLSAEDKTEKAKKSNASFKKMHLDFFADLNSEICNAFRLFVEKWNPLQMENNPKLLALGKEISNAYFGFCLEGLREPLEQDSGFIDKYQMFYQEQQDQSDEPLAFCAVYGEMLPISQLHREVSFNGNKFSKLVCMNDDAFESYGKTQSYNSNISEQAMKKYTAAMNRLLSDRNHYKTIGDLVLMYFAIGKEQDDSTECAWFGAQLGFPMPDWMKEQDTKQADAKLDTLGKQMTGGGISLLPEQGLDEDFYIVGMTPNSSRICQKFIMHDKFGNIVRNLKQHQNDLRVNPDTTRNIYFSQITKELVSPKSKDEKVPPPLMSSLMLAALQGTPYPTALLSTVIRRVKTDSDGENDHTTKLNDVRAGIIKACLNRNYKKGEIKMAWDENNRNPAYLCGSLFAVYEKIQKDFAAPAKLNRTIKDSYFASACSCPNVILPRLEKLSQNHIKKLTEGTAVYYQKLVDLLMNGLEGGFPSTLSLDDQGRFIVGYHQMNARLYTKKPEQED